MYSNTHLFLIFICFHPLENDIPNDRDSFLKFAIQYPQNIE